MGTFMVRYYRRRPLFISGYIAIAIVHGAIGACALLKIDIEVLIMITLFNFIFFLTIGPTTWVYVIETTNDSTSLTVCLFTLWTTILILSLVCPIIMSPTCLGPIPVFFVFSGFSLIGAIYSIFIIKESKDLTKED